MEPYQRYSIYRERRTTSRGQLVRWFIYLLILIALVWIVTSCLRRPDDQSNGTDEASNQNATAASENSNASNSNSNTNANSNINASLDVSEGSFKVATDCEGPISLLSQAGKKVSLTFGSRGDGANAAEVIKILKDANAPASFFFTGSFAKSHPTVVKTVSDAGFRVYNQSDSNPDFETITEDEALTELEQADEKISAVTGRTTKPFFRPPYGSVDDAVTATVKSAGYCPVTWTVDGMDWKADSTADSVTTQVMSRVKNGAIVMLNVGSSSVTAALPNIISQVRSGGYTLVTLAELIIGS